MQRTWFMKIQFRLTDMIRCTNTEHPYVTAWVDNGRIAVTWTCSNEMMRLFELYPSIGIDANVKITVKPNNAAAQQWPRMPRMNHVRCMSVYVWLVGWRLSIRLNFFFFQLKSHQLDTVCCIFRWLQRRKINIRIEMACHKPFPPFEETRLELRWFYSIQRWCTSAIPHTLIARATECD